MQKPQSCEIATGVDLFGVFKQDDSMRCDDFHIDLAERL